MGAQEQMDALLGQFDEIDDPYLRSRKTDVIQVVERVLAALLLDTTSVAMMATPEDGSILVAHDCRRRT